MGSELETLFKLQELDVHLLDKQGEIDKFEDRLAARRRSIEACAAEIEGLGQKRKQLITERALAERRVDDGQEQLKERRQRMSRVRTERELRANEGEVAALRQEIDEHEDQFLLADEQVGQIEAELAELRKKYGELEQEDHRQIEEESGRIEALKAELAAEREARDAVAAGLDPALRGRYEAILKQRTGNAVVRIVGGICAGCYMHIPPQTVIEIAKSGVVRVCPSCQRILCVVDDEQEASEQ